MSGLLLWYHHSQYFLRNNNKSKTSPPCSRSSSSLWLPDGPEPRRAPPWWGRRRPGGSTGGRDSCECPGSRSATWLLTTTLWRTSYLTHGDIYLQKQITWLCRRRYCLFLRFYSMFLKEMLVYCVLTITRTDSGRHNSLKCLVFGMARAPVL